MYNRCVCVCGCLNPSVLVKGSCMPVSPWAAVRFRDSAAAHYPGIRALSDPAGGRPEEEWR